jgi:hypothetical protein
VDIHIYSWWLTAHSIQRSNEAVRSKLCATNSISYLRR